MLEIKDLNMIDDSSKSETSENDSEDIPVGQEKSGADAGSAKCRFFLLLYFLVVAHSCCVSSLLLECRFPQIFFQVRSGSGCCMNCLHRYQVLIINCARLFNRPNFEFWTKARLEFASER